jgi:phosphohistidine phosphatase
MFVGHLPFMARLASLLVTGASADSVVGFQMGGIVCLERDPTSRAWMVRWIVTPDLVP